MYPIRASYHSSACTKIKISKDGCFALSSGRDGKVNILNAFTGELLGDYTTSPTQAVVTFEMTSDNKYVFVLGLLGQVVVYNMIEGTKIGQFKAPLKIFGSEMSLGNDNLVLCGDKFAVLGLNRFCVFGVQKIIDNLRTGKDITQDTAKYFYEEKDMGTAKCIKYGYLNRNIIAGTETGSILLFTPELVLQKKFELFNQQTINSITYSPKYEFLLVASSYGCKVLHPDTFEAILDYRADHIMNCAQMSPIMYAEENPMFHVIMGGGTDKEKTADSQKGGLDIEFIHSMSGKLCATLPGHFGPVNWIECFADGSGIITAGEEGILRIYKFDKSYYEDEKFK